MKTYYSFFMAIMFVSCSNRLHVPRNQDSKPMNFLAMKEIMKNVKNHIHRPTHLIVAFQYTHTSQGTITLYRFNAIIYDCDNKMRLYLVNEDNNQFKTYFSSKTPQFETMDLILKYYVDGRLNELLKSQERFKDGGDNAFIFDINFAENTTREYDFDQLSFDDNGNLTTFKKMWELRQKAKSKY